jgi:hypothetical protein
MEATRYWWSLASLIIVTALAAAGPSVAPSCADTCCVNTQLVQKNCHTTGCSGTIYVVECADNFGTGTNYQTMSVRCCTDLYNTLTSPSGRCAAAPTAGPTNVQLGFLRTEKLWVRGCDGRYILLSVPVKS